MITQTLRVSHWIYLTLIVLSIPLQVLAEQESSDARGITLSLDNADIIDLVRWASDVTDKNIILHPHVKGRITVLAGEPMTQQEAYDVFLSVLQVHDLAIINAGNSLKVIPAASSKTSSIAVTDKIININSEEMIVKVIKVKNVSANNLLSLLRPLIPQSGYVAAYPQTNMLIVAARTHKIQQITDIIQRMDEVGIVDIELIDLKFASAREVNEVISKLIPKPTGKNTANSFTLAVDDRSNSLLMTGDPVSRKQIRTLVNRLDQPLQGEGNTQVVRIQYANAKDLVPLLKSVSGSVKSRSKDQGFADIDVNIEPHEQLNALVITAPPSILSTMKGVIAELDKPRAQVLVEALIVEVNEDLAHNLGVEWRTQPIGDGSGVVGGFRSFPGGLLPLGIKEGIDNGGEGTNFTLGSGLSLGYFSGGDLRGIINALQGDSNANILATPTILALDNEKASILVGSNVPFITGSQQRPGDINSFQTIQRQDIGLTLAVTPRVNNHNSVTLDIEQKVESITQSAVETADIVTNKREIKTRVLIGNDQVLVLGGLIRDEITESENKVPLLGDIPWLGRLFKSSSVIVTKANLMVFIHPIILSTSTELNQHSREQYNDMRNRQKDFNQNSENFFIMNNKPLLPELNKREIQSKPAVGENTTEG